MSTIWPNRTPPSSGPAPRSSPGTAARSCTPTATPSTCASAIPIAQEDAARRAVHAALDIRELTRVGVPATQATAQRCWLSVHTGTVVVRQAEDDTIEVTGDPLAVVKRIESATEPGEVFATHDAWRLASGHFEAEEAGRRAVRGAREPIELFRVVRAVTGFRPFETEGVALTPLIGRDQEMGLLFDRWNQTSEGRGQAVMLTGDAGLGKSRLVHVLRSHVTVGETSPVVEWRCSAYHSNSALYPAIDYWERTLGFAPGDTPREQLERLKEYLRGFDLPLADTVPMFASLMGLPDDDEYPAPAIAPQRKKELTAELIAAWLAARASKAPLLFVVEDLHWVDPTTLDLLVSLVDAPLPEPLMIVFTFRPEFPPPWTSRRVTQIALDHLTRAQISEMIRSRAGVVAPAGRVHRARRGAHRRRAAVRRGIDQGARGIGPALRDRIWRHRFGPSAQLGRPLVIGHRPGVAPGHADGPAGPARRQQRGGADGGRDRP